LDQCSVKASVNKKVSSLDLKIDRSELFVLIKTAVSCNTHTSREKCKLHFHRCPCKKKQFSKRKYGARFFI